MARNSDDSVSSIVFKILKHHLTISFPRWCMQSLRYHLDLPTMRDLAQRAHFHNPGFWTLRPCMCLIVHALVLHPCGSEGAEWKPADCREQNFKRGSRVLPSQPVYERSPATSYMDLGVLSVILRKYVSEYSTYTACHGCPRVY